MLGLSSIFLFNFFLHVFFNSTKTSPKQQCIGRSLNAKFDVFLTKSRRKDVWEKSLIWRILWLGGRGWVGFGRKLWKNTIPVFYCCPNIGVPKMLKLHGSPDGCQYANDNRASQIVTKTVEGTALSGYETSALCVSNHYNLYHYIEELHSLDLTVKSNNV